MTEPAENEAENVNDDAQEIELYERRYTCDPVNDHQHRMHETHYSNSK